MQRIMILGATGLVGGHALARALEHPRVAEVVAPARSPLQAHPRLHSPRVDFARLPADAPWWGVDAVLCALGTTRRDAGSAEAFFRIDHDFPLQAARLAREHGVANFVLVSSAGASARSRLLYPRTKGRLEHAIQGLGFESLTVLRPSLLLGTRVRARPLEQLGMQAAPLLAALLPARYRPVRAADVAAAMLQAALAPVPGVTVIERGAIPSSAA